MQFVALVHDTAESWLESGPPSPGVGVASADHFVPFQRSASELTECAWSSVPTAMQVVVVGHDTAATWPKSAPGAVPTSLQEEAAPAGE